MGIKAEEDLLFEKLRISLPEAVCDGVVDEKSFFSARYRIVYILKEVNGGVVLCQDLVQVKMRFSSS